MDRNKNIIDLRCCNCGKIIGQKIIDGEKGFGGVILKCSDSKCGTINTFTTEDKKQDQPYGERIRFTRKTA